MLGPNNGCHVWERDRQPQDCPCPRWPQRPHRLQVCGQTLYELVRVHAQSLAPSALRSADIPRWTDTLRAPMLVPVAAAASFSDISLSFISSIACRWPGGSSETARARASPSRYSLSEVFAIPAGKVSEGCSECASWAARRAYRRALSAMRLRAMAMNHGR